MVWKLDRLGRSVKHLVDFVGELQQQGVQFKSLTDSIDTGTPSGRFFFHVMASLAAMERELIVERTRAGLKIARQLWGNNDGILMHFLERDINPSISHGLEVNGMFSSVR